MVRGYERNLQKLRIKSLSDNIMEEPLPAGGSCLLSSINLSAFVVEPFKKHAYFDFVEFRRAIDLIIREMNVLLDEGLPLHPLQEQRDSVAKWRQIGLGIMGLADMFIKLDLTYGSYASRAMAERVAKIMTQQALLTSAQLAKEHGMYPGCNIEELMRSEFYQTHKTREIDELVSKYGLRNSQLLTIAPTGTISTMLGISGGIEPIFATKFIRTTKTLHGQDTSYTVYTQIVKECMDAYGLDKEPDHIVTAMDLDPDNRIKMQAMWQKYIDAAISSTINLPNETTPEQVFDIYVSAWKHGLKGLTVYRAGCEREGILAVAQDEEEMKVTHTDNLCQECGAELVMSGGCSECHNCGWSKCEIKSGH